MNSNSLGRVVAAQFPVLAYPGPRTSHPPRQLPVFAACFMRTLVVIPACLFRGYFPVLHILRCQEETDDGDWRFCSSWKAHSLIGFELLDSSLENSHVSTPEEQSKEDT